MDRYFEVMRMTMHLAASCLECIQHIEYELEAGYLQQTILLLEDLTQAFSQMERSLQLFLADLPTNEIDSLTDELRYALESLLSAYEKKDAGKAYDCIQESLLPVYQSWKYELEKSIHCYIVS